MQQENAKVVTPLSLYTFLDQHIVGQERAKRVLALAVAMHYQRAMSGFVLQPYEERPKSNVFLIGPTATGKTRMPELLAQHLSIPFITTDATIYSETGYVGKDVDDMIAELLQKAEYNVALAEKGIIHIDEIDKIAKTQDSHNHDVSRDGVQRGLLRLLESNKITIKENKFFGGKEWEIETRNILFILSGAFEGLQEITAGRLKKETSMGFGSTLYSRQELEMVQPSLEDLVVYGFSPQFIGRIPSVAQLHAFSEEQLYDILKLPMNGDVQKKIEEFYLSGISLEFTDDAFRALAKKAFSYKTNGRALRRVLDETLEDFLFDLPTTEVNSLVVHQKMVEQPKQMLKEIMQKHPAKENKTVHYPSLEHCHNLLSTVYQHQLGLLGVSLSYVPFAAAYGKKQGFTPAEIFKLVEKAKQEVRDYAKEFSKQNGITVHLLPSAEEFLLWNAFYQENLEFPQQWCQQTLEKIPLQQVKEQGVSEIKVSEQDFFYPHRFVARLSKKKKEEKQRK